MRVLLATLDLERVDAGINKCLEAVGRIEVAHREQESGARLADDFIWLPACVRALTAIPGPRVVGARKETQAAVTVTKAAVTERLELHHITRELLTDFFQFQRRQLTRQDHAPESPVDCLLDTGRVVNGELRRGMQPQSRKELANDFSHREVLDDHRVDSSLLETRQRLHEVAQFVFLDQDVDRDEDFHPIRVRQGNQFPEILDGKIFRAGSRVELLEAKIDGVRARVERGHELLAPPGRGKDFGASNLVVSRVKHGGELLSHIIRKSMIH